MSSDFERRQNRRSQHPAKKFIKEKKSSIGRIVEPPSTDPFGKEDVSVNYFDYQMKFNLTARIPNSQWQIKDLSLLLDTLNYEIAVSGCNFNMYLTLELLFTILTGTNNPWDVKDERIRITCIATHSILRDLQGEFYQFGDKLILEPRTLKFLRENELIITKRVYGSRKEFYRAERFVEIQAVPIKQSLERRQGSERYSGYTKGYGEGGSTAPKQKTRFSTELDGETDDIPLRFDLMNISRYLSFSFLEYIQKIRKNN
jgi:hypothetical protein